jgi:hypothetical protein
MVLTCQMINSAHTSLRSDLKEVVSGVEQAIQHFLTEAAEKYDRRPAISYEIPNHRR